jgi:hypothetical protein
LGLRKENKVMTEQDKKLLLIDLSARVQYGIMVEQTLFPQSLADKEQRLKSVQANYVVQLYWYKYINEFVPIHCIKPYLRPMSSMTEEESNEYRMFIDYSYNDFTSESTPCVYIDKINEYLDWLNVHHFDYRGLIEKGLAIEAPEGMYNIKEK